MAKIEDKAAVPATDEEAVPRHLTPSDPQLNPNVAVDSPAVTGVDPEAEVRAHREAKEAEKDQESIDAAIAAGVNPINIPPEGLPPQGSDAEDLDDNADDTDDEKIRKAQLRKAREARDRAHQDREARADGFQNLAEKERKEHNREVRDAEKADKAE